MRFSFALLLIIFYLSRSMAADSRPNVLFIAIDDLRTDLGCYGNRVVRSPNLDAFAERATLFNRAYCQQAVCNPSRASTLTGLRLNSLRIWDLPKHFRQEIPDIVTLPQMFKNNGYHAQCIGKVFHNWRQDDFKGDPDSWSVPQVMHYNSHGNDKPIVQGDVPPNLSDTPKCEIRDVPDEAYFDGRIAQQAVEALRDVKDKPFFLAVGFWKPHSHFNAPKRYWDLYDRSDITAASNPERAHERSPNRIARFSRNPWCFQKPARRQTDRRRSDHASARLLRQHFIHGRPSWESVGRTGQERTSR